MRERGSNAALLAKKCGGGLPIGACLADFVVKTRLDLVDWRVDASDDAKDKTQKKPDPLNRGIGLAPAAMYRELLAFR